MSQDVMQLVLKNFDVDAFLHTEYVEAGQTEKTLFPQGEMRIETIKDFEIVKPRMFKDENGEQFLVSPKLKLKMLVTDEGIRDQLNAKEGKDLIFYYAINIQLNENGQIDWGPNANLDLARLRAALGQNIEGIVWGFNQLKNCQPFYVAIAHQTRMNQPDGALFEKVTAWYAERREEAAAA